MKTSLDANAVPVVRRARGFRLYDRQGRRYLDLYRDGGGTLLGHRSGRTITLMKGVLSQGLASAVPSIWEARLVHEIAAMFPTHRTVRLFSSRARALEGVSRFAGMPIDPSDLLDPAIHAGPIGQSRVMLWRPFLSEPDASASMVLPVLPLTVCEAPAPVCFPDVSAGKLPPSDRIPGFVLAGAYSALVQLRRAGAPFAVNAVIQKAIDASPGWARTGPYVRATFDPDLYPRVFGEFLDSGVLLCPAFPGPNILPGECSPGEARLLAQLFTSIPGG